MSCVFHPPRSPPRHCGLLQQLHAHIISPRLHSRWTLGVRVPRVTERRVCCSCCCRCYLRARVCPLVHPPTRHVMYAGLTLCVCPCSAPPHCAARGSVLSVQWLATSPTSTPHCRRCLRIAAASGFAGLLWATPESLAASLPRRMSRNVGMVSTPSMSRVASSRASMSCGVGARC